MAGICKHWAVGRIRFAGAGCRARLGQPSFCTPAGCAAAAAGGHAPPGMPCGSRLAGVTLDGAPERVEKHTAAEAVSEFAGRMLLCCICHGLRV